jgi:molybdenum cofactor synthesis domain-containing protein
MVRIKIELLSFGNELLIGEIVNTNSYWLAKVFSQAGAKITRMLTISDDLDEISAAFKEAISRNPDIIISTGGLGPTWDDQTLRGLGRAVNKNLIRNNTALKMIQDKYNELQIELAQPGMKMADIPEGAFPLHNRKGTAPGIKFKFKSTVIFCLPGIPKEMKALVQDHILPYLKTINPSMQYYESKFEIKDSYESKIAETTKKYVQQYPSIYIKSHPKKHGLIIIHLTTYGTKSQKILLEQVKKELMGELSKLGSIEDLEPIK